jgi:hypothetical protein
MERQTDDNGGGCHDGRYHGGGAISAFRQALCREAAMGIYSVGVSALFALVFSVSLARADDIPVLQVEQVCHGIVDQSGGSLTVGDPKVAFDQCIAGEKSDRESLSKEWSTFTADDKRHCTAETKMGGESSYTELITCLEMARDVRNLRAGTPTTKSSTPEKGKN